MFDQKEIIESMLVDETIHHVTSNPYIRYDDLVQKVSWYWKLPNDLKSGWIGEWIRLLAVDG